MQSRFVALANDMKRSQVKLVDAPNGPVRVLALAGGAAEEARLVELGLHVGARVEVVQHNGEGGVLVAVNGDTRLAVDRATAQMVQVVPLEPSFPSATIASMQPGERARVVGFGKERLDYRQRLMAMGLTPGVEFELTRVAPLGDPVEIRVRGFAMSLRKDEAMHIVVEKLP